MDSEDSEESINLVTNVTNKKSFSNKEKYITTGVLMYTQFAYVSRKKINKFFS